MCGGGTVPFDIIIEPKCIFVDLEKNRHRLRMKMRMMMMKKEVNE